MAFDPIDRDRWYAGCRFHGLMITDDAGLDWTRNADPGLDRIGPTPLAIAPSLAFPGEILVAGDGGFARSTDGGQTFVRSNAGLEDLANAAAIAVDSGDEDHLVVKTGGSAYVSLDAGATWTESITTGPFGGNDVIADQVVSGRFWAAVYEPGGAGSVWRSDDGGFSFQRVFQDPLIYFWNMEPHPDQANVVFGAGRGLQRSDDGGETFTNLGVPSNWVWDVAISPVDTDVMYASTSSTVYATHDGGATWTPATVPPAPIVRDLVVDPVDPDRAWATVPYEGDLYRTDDGGATWTAAAPSLYGAQVAHRSAAHGGLLVVSHSLTPTVHGSVTLGDTSFDMGLRFGSNLAELTSTSTAIYASTNGDGVYAWR